MKVVAILRYTFLETSNVLKLGDVFLDQTSDFCFFYCTVEVLLLDLYCGSDCKSIVYCLLFVCQIVQIK